MAEITWKIAELEREVSDGYVYTIHWRVQAIDGDYSSDAYGSIGLERPADELIDFEDLTEETVIDWTKSSLGEDVVTSLEEDLVSQIELKKSPITAKGLPW